MSVFTIVGNNEPLYETEFVQGAMVRSCGALLFGESRPTLTPPARSAPTPARCRSATTRGT